ncbi:MAG: ABC transporter permease [Chloroflexi bacterium]|nr:ABC transporter permease [Chloroflexota bacterium]MBV9898509.1 ABC transporter permease [Chloroflexota bacterium]
MQVAAERTVVAPTSQVGAQRLRTTDLPRLAARYPRVALFGAIILLLILIGIFAPLLAQYDPIQTAPTHVLEQPSPSHILGTDNVGRDQFTRVIYGTRISLGVAVIAVTIALSGGVLMGLAAGYVGGATDQVLSRLIDALLAFPGVLLAIAVTSALGPSLRNAMIAVGIIQIPLYFRLTRGQVLQAREHEYVVAAAVIGATHVRILARHIVPNIANPLIVAASISSSTSILALAALGFIGVGPQPPDPDWGSMINTASGALSQAPWLSFGPGIAIFLTVFSFSMLGDALRDALDPRLRIN